ncbi:N-acetylmuramoyl-L-alanine amidase [Geodermatophilus maliterrae]|uniref:N-acetylmuramoyl-L-alanine amidase n=1 Tax=Geodermatophilus maliterrae TaxID=3162531 RepID=A0ABV3XE94_9ACTN
MRRLLAGSVAFVAMTGLLLVLPVHADTGPEAVPVETSAEELAMGSVTAPAPGADVREGATDPVSGVTATTPVLTLQETGVEEFSLVGVTWRHDPAVTDTLVQVRVQDQDGSWGAWTEVGREDAEPGARSPASDEVRQGTAPLWTGPSTGVEVGLVTRSGAQPTDVQLDLVDPGESDADDSLGTPDIQDTADAAMAMPDVYSRAQWGADERLRTWRPQYAATLKAATLHHTADSNAYSADQVPGIMRSIYRYHAVSLGWGDIGYNVVVDKYGRLWEGRSGGLASTVMGAHAGGFNTSTFGVSMLGNYDVAATTDAMVQSVAAIIAWKFDLYGIDPRGTTTLTSSGGGTSRYASGARVTLPTVFGHRDVGSTACPGRYGYARLGEIRDRAGRMLAAAASPVTERYDADPFARSQLGPPTTAEFPTGGGDGRFRFYVNGGMYWSPATGVHFVLGDLYTRWAALGWERSPLGFPTSDTAPTGGGDGRYNLFQRGALYTSPSSGTHYVLGAIHQRWVQLGWEHGFLGYPTGDTLPTRNGDARWSAFQGGAVYETPRNGVRVLSGRIHAAWAASGWEHGPLGYPVTDALPTSGRDATYQLFERGAVYASRAGVHHLTGDLHRRWAQLGYEHGSLGYPTSDDRPAAGGTGRTATFEGGALYAGPTTGVHAVQGPIGAAYDATGGDAGPLGLPTSDAVPTGGRDATYQLFEHGAVYASRTGVHVMVGDVHRRWVELGWEHGPLGYPTADPRPLAGTTGLAAQVQTFEGGTVVRTTAGTHVLRRTAALWGSLGAEGGTLGVPTGDELPTRDGDGRYALFAGGAVYWSPATGTHELVGPVHQRWVELGWEHGRLGYPVTGSVPTATGWRTDFQGGSIGYDTTTRQTTVTYR